MYSQSYELSFLKYKLIMAFHQHYTTNSVLICISKIQSPSHDLYDQVSSVTCLSYFLPWPSCIRYTDFLVILSTYKADLYSGPLSYCSIFLAASSHRHLHVLYLGSYSVVIPQKGVLISIPHNYLLFFVMVLVYPFMIYSFISISSKF